MVMGRTSPKVVRIEDHGDHLDGEAEPLAEQLHGDGGRDGRGADVDQGDADQEGHEQLVRPLDEGRGRRLACGLRWPAA